MKQVLYSLDVTTLQRDPPLSFLRRQESSCSLDPRLREDDNRESLHSKLSRILCKSLKTPILILFLIFLGCKIQAMPSQTVNVYCWAYMLPPQIIKQFEQDTGISVNYDVYDSAEVMETKLFAGHSGYDVVLVTVWPYLLRQLEANIYQPLNFSLLPNWKGANENLLKRMEEVDPGNRFAVPILWGTTGFAFNKAKILERLPKAPLQSWAMLFDPSVVSHFAKCGVMLLDSPTDVFPSALSYLKKNPNSDSLEDLKEASTVLSKVRPYIRKFQPISSPRDLVSGDYCLVQGYSGELNTASKLGKQHNMNIEYVIPEEGAALWVDSFSIPKDAPHVKEAHIFINFILRPDIIAQITEATETANSVPLSFPFIPENVRSNPLIYPPTEKLKKLYIDKTHSPRYERLRLREWTRVKTGR